MNTLNHLRSTLICLSLVLTACGGDGGSSGGTDDGGDVGSTTQAMISAANVDDIGFMASAGARQAVEGESAPPVSNTRYMKPMLSSKPMMAGGNMDAFPPECASGTAMGDVAELTFDQCVLAGAYNLCESGTLMIDGVISGDEEDATYTWGQCAYAPSYPDHAYYPYTQDGYVISGTGHNVTADAGDKSTYTYDITTEYGGSSNAYSGTKTCSGLLGENPHCENAADFNNAGRNFAISAASISRSNESGGFTVSSRVSSEELGYVEITTTSALIFSCDNHWPSAGSIEIAAQDSDTALVEYTSCDSFTVTHDGMSQTYSWSSF